jgi:hypothetical protein
MKRFVVLMIAALASGQAVAAEYGIGISAKSDNGLLYFPIDVSSRFRVEPYLRHMSSDSTQTTDFGGETTTFESESDLVEGGVGIFGLAVPKESVRLYFGGRASYFDGDTRSTTSELQFKQSTHGYRVTPTVGFEYLFNSRFTLGGEIGYFFEKRNVDSRNIATHSESESDNTGTESFLILRYFF